MISITRQLSESIAFDYVYQFAGQAVVFNEPVHSLSAFELGGSKQILMPDNDLLWHKNKLLYQAQLLTSHNSELVYQGKAQFDQKMRSIDYWRSGNVAQIDVDGVPSCRLDLQSECIVLLNDKPFDTPFNLELVTGPALILLLSQQSIFCLHAGAISFQSSAGRQANVAFLADSGVGKSTLSRDFPSVWRQLSDDILPIQLKESSVELFNDFPQLKLDRARVEVTDLSNKNLDFIVCLNSEFTNEITIKKMPAVESVLAIIRHTVASRLFDKDLLRRHCAFAQSLSQTIPVFQVRYPRDYAQLPELRKRIMGCVIEVEKAGN